MADLLGTWNVGSTYSDMLWFQRYKFKDVLNSEDLVQKKKQSKIIITFMFSVCWDYTTLDIFNEITCYLN